MPPKAKFTREEIIDAAVALVESEGIDALTARSLGEKLGSSPRPIFTVFDGMSEVTDAVFRHANALYSRYVEEGLHESLAFRGVGKAYIRFAAEHPRLFQLLFMRERSSLPDKESVLVGIEEHYGNILQSIVKEYDVSTEHAKQIYFHLWVYSHGIAVLLATKVCSFTPQEISQNITEVCKSILTKIKRDGSL